MYVSCFEMNRCAANFFVCFYLKCVVAVSVLSYSRIQFKLFYHWFSLWAFSYSLHCIVNTLSHAHQSLRYFWILFFNFHNLNCHILVTSARFCRLTHKSNHGKKKNKFKLKMFSLYDLLIFNKINEDQIKKSGNDYYYDYDRSIGRNIEKSLMTNSCK